MKIRVIGATGGSGRSVVENARWAGHEVTGFARAVSSADLLPAWHTLLQMITGAELSLAQLQP